MSTDEPFYTPGRVVPSRVPQPGEPLWAFRSADHHTWSCELRVHGEFGVEAQILKDGELVIGRRFDLKGQANRLNSRSKRLRKAREENRTGRITLPVASHPLCCWC